MKIAFGCDHGGFIAKQKLFEYFESKGFEVTDYGCFDENSVDYPDIAYPVCKDVQAGDSTFGVLVCGTGIGMSIVANKIKGVRCAHVTDEFSAEMTRRHNDTNVIALGGRISTVEEIVKYVDIFLNTPFEGGRHLNRVNKIKIVEEENFN
ncbi:MAG: ribose 5-phosphate isomerase B [Clostridia bacterium]|nr:ribose 5-phosphate isomerase B [Clostridia bacterium]